MNGAKDSNTHIANVYSFVSILTTSLDNHLFMKWSSSKATAERATTISLKSLVKREWTSLFCI